MSNNWPPELKTLVNETFAKCTDSNRATVEAELKALILRKFQTNELLTTDWKNVKLTSLNPPKRKAIFVPPAYHDSRAVAAEGDKRLDRLKRFKAEAPPPGSGMAGRLAGRTVASPYTAYSTPEPEFDSNVLDWDKHTIVGTSQKLEKPYLRLTSLPDPTTIRPLPVLEKTLELLKAKWREEQNYPWICDQFKSMRQDLTVQRIKNEFTCNVYEIHARIALEKGELGEFNQCQTQLRELYKALYQSDDQKAPPKPRVQETIMEFLAYRILYLVHTRNRAEMNKTLTALSDTERQHPSVAHALAVRQAVSQGNYTRVFKLFCSAPKMGAYVMDHFVPRERVSALLTMAKAYITIPLTLVESQLAFDSVDEVESFLEENGVAVFKPTKDGKSVDAKAVAPKLADKHASFVKEGKKPMISHEDYVFLFSSAVTGVLAYLRARQAANNEGATNAKLRSAVRTLCGEAQRLGDELLTELAEYFQNQDYVVSSTRISTPLGWVQAAMALRSAMEQEGAMMHSLLKGMNEKEVRKDWAAGAARLTKVVEVVRSLGGHFALYIQQVPFVPLTTPWNGQLEDVKTLHTQQTILVENFRFVRANRQSFALIANIY
ncbi:nuclear export factor [Pseudohyphozyma bogoriensis]|nr:nuclear export factor [Pseudohyphozyma bogoriensis]